MHHRQRDWRTERARVGNCRARVGHRRSFVLFAVGIDRSRPSERGPRGGLRTLPAKGLASPALIRQRRPQR